MCINFDVKMLLCKFSMENLDNLMKLSKVNDLKFCYDTLEAVLMNIPH